VRALRIDVWSDIACPWCWAEARARGISAVPHFAIGRHAIGGAQPPELRLAALEAAWREIAPVSGIDAGACGPEGCG